jgi:hypothetical protein
MSRYLSRGIEDFAHPLLLRGAMGMGWMIKLLFKDRRASVSIVGALMLPVLIGMTGLVAEYGRGLLTKVEDQRVADLAAYAGATAYNSTGSTTTMNSVIDEVALLNGIPAANIAGSLVSSPSGDGNQAVKVAVSTTNTIVLSTLVGSPATLPVGATAYAELKANAAGCIIALNTAGTGVTLSGASNITANACAVDSNNTVSVPCSTFITSIMVTYDSSSAPSQPCGGIQPPSGQSVKILKTLTADPLAGNSGVSTATARLPSVAALASPSAPSVTGGTAINFALGAGSTVSNAAADGCTASLAGSTWTVTCPSGGTYHFGAITDGGSVTVKFNTTGSAATTYDFSGGINVSSASNFTFGPGTFNIAGGLTTTSSSSATFGAGTFNVGPSTTACADGGKYSICANSSTSVTIGGPSTFNFSGGVYTGMSANLTLGAGSTNSFDIGASSNGNALNTAMSSNTIFADATGGSSVFEMVGNVTAANSSCVTIANAAQHDINGAVIAAASSNMTMGSGVYTVHGYLDIEASSGGGGCLGTTSGKGIGITFVTDGVTTPASGSCAGMAVCVLASSGSVLVAPTSGVTAGLAVIGPISPSNTEGALFKASSTGSFSGAFYFPHGPITVANSSGLGGGTSQCLELIGSQVTVSSASGVVSTCITGAASNYSIVLVQ